MSSLNTVKPEVLKSKLLLRDVASEMKKEFDRRKKLRLQQVRQQSKDLACTLREKVRLEKSHQRNLCKNKTQKHLSQFQEEKLNDLQAIYKNCLEGVGQSHLQAAEQPNIESVYLAEQKRNKAKAANRGLKAIQKKRIIDDENKYRDEAPLIQKQLVRTKEDIRSILISSLSPPTSYSKSHTTEPPRKTEQHPKITVLQEIPTNIQLDTVEAKRSPIQIDKASDRATNYKGISTKNNPSTCTDCGYACCCHRGSSKRSLRRRCFSESRLISDSETEYDSDSTWPPRTSPRSQKSDYSRRATSVIKCYDFTNNFRKKYKKPFLITRHGQGDSSGVRSIKEVQSEVDLAQKKTKKLKEMSEKERHRGRLALYKERIARDFDNLRKELETLSREENKVRSMPSRIPHSLTGDEYQPRGDLLQRRFERNLHNTPNIVTIEQTTSTLSSEEPNVVNVTRREYISSPSSARPVSPLQEVLDRIEERRKILLHTLDPDEAITSQNLPSRAKGPVYKVSSEEKYRFNTPIYGDKSDSTTNTRMYTDEKKKVDVRVKSPRDIVPTVDVEVNKSSIGLNVKGLDQKERDLYSSSFDGVTVTIRVKKDPLAGNKPDRMNLKKRLYLNDSSSTSYNSPPDTVSPSKKVVVDRLVKDLEVKGSSRDYLLPYINKLLSMSRESIDEMGGTVSETHTISVQPTGQNGAGSTTLNETHTVSFQPAGQDRARPTTLYETTSTTFKPGSDELGYEIGESEVENLKSMYDTLTDTYLEKLFAMSNSFKDLLKNESLDGRRIDMTGWNWEQGVISADSSYFNLPSKINHSVFPIHQKTVASAFKEYPKADQTFQELADILVRQEMAMNNLPDNLLPMPPSLLSSVQQQNTSLLNRLDMSVPFVPDIRARFDFINPDLLASPGPSDPNDTSGSIDVFHGINIADYNFNSAPGPNQQVYTAIQTDTTNSEIKFNTPMQQNFNVNQAHNLSSPEEIETELRKMGLGWAGATLRKTRAAAELSSGSSSGRSRLVPSVKIRDRALRPRQNPRSSSPINSEQLPLYMFSTSTDSVGSGVGQYSKKKRKTTKQTITRVRTPLSSDLSPPNLSLRTPTIKSPNTSARSMNSRRLI